MIFMMHKTTFPSRHLCCITKLVRVNLKAEIGIIRFKKSHFMHLWAGTWHNEKEGLLRVQSQVLDKAFFKWVLSIQAQMPDECRAHEQGHCKHWATNLTSDLWLRFTGDRPATIHSTQHGIGYWRHSRYLGPISTLFKSIQLSQFFSSVKLSSC